MNPSKKILSLLALFCLFLTPSCGEDAESPVLVNCRLNSDCAVGEKCQDTVCVADEEVCVGDSCPCLSDSDCGTGQGCEQATGECFDLECLTDSNCGVGDVCVGGLCVTDVDADRDRDGVPDNEDVCFEVADSEQEDNDQDGRGDACDDDDDNDAIPDTLDNCPLDANPLQGDANGDDIGNACDEEVDGITISGSLDFSELPTADASAAQIYITGSQEAQRVTPEGNFVVEDAMAEPGGFIIRVVWPGFETIIEEHAVADGVENYEIPTLTMVPVSQGEDAIVINGVALMDGADTHSEILIQARVGGSLVETTLTGVDGSFLLRLGPLDHELTISKSGFEDLQVDLIYNDQGEFAGGFTVDGVAIEETPLVLQSIPTAIVRGRLFSPLNPEDWPSRAFVTLISEDEQIRRLAPVVTELNEGFNKGSFEFTGLPITNYTLFVSARGHLPAERAVLAENLADLLDDLGDINLEREASAVLLRGNARLLDIPEDGDQSGVIIRATVQGQPVATGVTDTDGDFAFQTSEEDHRLTLSKEGYEEQVVDLNWNTVLSRFEREGVAFDSQAGQVSLTPLATFSVFGRLDSTLENVTDWPSRAFVSLISADEQTRRIEPVLTDGSFQFNGLRPGEYSLSISARGHVSVQSLPIDLQDANEDLGTIVLTAEALDDENAVLMRGVVRLSDAGVDGDNSGITVRGRDGGNLVFTTTTDDTGAFVAVVSQIRHVLTFSKVGYISSGEFTAEFVPGENEEDPGSFEFEGRPLQDEVFTLEPRQTATLSGTMTSPLQVDDWTSRSLVVVIGENTQRVASISNQDGDGRFDVAGLRSGPITLSIQVQGHLPVVRQIELPAEGLDLDPIALVPERVSFTGGMVNGADAPLEGVIVRAKRGVNTADTDISDDNGQFTLDLTPELHTLTFTKNGFQPHSVVRLRWNGLAFDVESDEEGEPPFKLLSVPTAVVRGALTSPLNPTDWPSRAFVTLVSGDETVRRLAPVVTQTVNGVNKGAFEIADLPLGSYNLFVSARGHLPEQVSIEAAALVDLEEELGDIALTREATAVILRGNVRLQDVAPEGDQSGAIIRATIGGEPVATSVTGGDGDFAFQTSQENHRLTISKAGYIEQVIDLVYDELEARFEVGGQPFDENNGQVVLTPVATFEVTGLLTSGLGPIDDWPSRAFVSLLSDNEEVRRIEPVLSDGSFQFTGLRPGGYTLGVSARGHLALSRAVAIVDADVALGTLQMTPEADDAETAILMRGIVRLADLAPEADHSGITVHGRVGGNLVFTTTTDNAGNFVAQASRVDHTLAFSKDGYIAGSATVTFVPDDDNLPDRFTVGADPINTTVNQIQPVATAVLTATLTSPLTINDWPNRSLVVVLGAGVQRVATVSNQDGNGLVQVSGLRPGDYTMSIQVQGHLPQSRDVTLPGEGLDLGLIDLTPDRVFFASTVTNVDSDPLEGVILRARRGDNTADTAISDEQGRFNLSLTPELHTLTLNRSGFQPHSPVTLTWNGASFDVEAEEGEPPFKMLSALTANLSGSMTSPLGINDWPNRSLVQLVGEGQQRVAVVATNQDGDGIFDVSGLLAGDYTMTIQVQGHFPVVQQVSIPNTGLTLAPIALEPQVVVYSEQVQAGGQGLPLAVVRARRENGNALADTTLTDSNGVFNLSLTPENHLVTINKEGFIEHDTIRLVWNGLSFDVDPPFEGEPPFILSEVPLATLSAQVSSSTGGRDDWPNIAFATLVSDGTNRITVVADDDGGRGQFQFVALDPGTYTLTVSAQGHLADSRSVTLVEGDNSAGLIELQADEEEQELIMRGRVLLQGEGENGDNGGVLVRATIAGNLVNSVQTGSDGLFAFIASRQNHVLTISKDNYITRQVTVLYDEVQEVFEIEDANIEDVNIELSQEAQSDLDEDGVIDVLDNCPRVANVNQENIDGDSFGDACDRDIDGDNFANGMDNCPLSFNPMQEDINGRGIGAVCSQGDINAPLLVGCGIRQQRVDTRGRADLLQGSCGGAGGAPEVVYNVNIRQGDTWQLEIEAEHAVVVYILDSGNQEQRCALGLSHTITSGEQLPAGRYKIVIDGFNGADSSGELDISISTDACDKESLPRVVIPANAPVASVDTGDIDGDGLSDIVAVSTVEDPDAADRFQLEVSLGASTVTDITVARTVLGEEVKQIKLADIDLDGSPDLIMVKADGGVGFKRNTNGTFGATVDTTLSDIEKVTIGDIDADGFPDIAAISSVSGVEYVLNNGDFTFGAAVTLPAVEFSPIDLALADMNQDGQQDVVIIRPPSTVSIMFNQGANVFNSEVPTSLGAVPVEFNVVDINEDGAPDVIAVNTDDDSIGVLLNTGLGRFDLPRRFSALGSPDRAIIGDITGDGSLDIIVSNLDNNQLQVLAGSGAGGFASRETISRFTASTGPLALGDFDGNDSLDLVEVTDDNVVIRARDIPFSFPTERLSDTDFAFKVELFDIDDDGDQDLIYKSPTEVVISELQSDGTFIDQTSFPSGSGGVIEEFGGVFQLYDFDRNGRLDILHPTGIIYSLTNEFFQEDYPSELILDGLVSIAPGQLDGDAEEELVTNQGLVEYTQTARDNDLTVVPFSGCLLDCNNIVGAAVGQFDSDPDLDIAVVDNVGSLTFQSYTPFDSERLIPAKFRIEKFQSLPTQILQSDVLRGFSLRVVAMDITSADTDELVLFSPRHPEIGIVVLGDGGEGGYVPLEDIGRADIAVKSVRQMDVDGDGSQDLVWVTDDIVLVDLLDSEGAKQDELVAEIGSGIHNDGVLQDVDNDGLLDVILADLATGSVKTLTRLVDQQESGIKFINSSLAPCAQTSTGVESLPNSQIGFIFERTNPCRVDRLELEVNHTAVNGDLSLTAPSGKGTTLLRLPNPYVPNDAIWRPELIGNAGRFEAHPLGGTWVVDTDMGPFTTLNMVVNRYPEDPFNPEGGAAQCDAADQPREPALACILPEGIQGLQASIADSADEDIFILPGPAEGTFLAGDIISVKVLVTPGEDLNIELRPHFAREKLATATRIEANKYQLTFTVPAAYNGRYFAVHIKSAGFNNSYQVVLE